MDDGSTDGTAELAGSFPDVTVVSGTGGGPGAARNLGWKSARGPLIWFVDADCVAEPEALELLLETLAGPAVARSNVAAAGGSYSNLFPESLVATLIHEEIVARHRRMPALVEFLATFNVLYRREVLEQLEGFDERFRKAQDAELAYRVRKAGYALAFDPRSRVGHHHPTQVLRYFRTQAAQGYWRVRLYDLYPGRTGGDGYSDTVDHVQPPLAAAIVGLLLLALVPGPRSIALVASGLGAAVLAALQLPMAGRIGRGAGLPRGLSFVPFGFFRAFARALGMSYAIPGLLSGRGARQG